MRLWTIADGRTGSEWCGACGKDVLNGQPMQLIRLLGVPDRKRCAKCARGPIDWDAVQAARASQRGRDPDVQETGFQPLANAGRHVVDRMQTFDPKLAAAGERDRDE